MKNLIFQAPCNIGDIVLDTNAILYQVIGFRYGYMCDEEQKCYEYHEPDRWYIECKNINGCINISVPVELYGTAIFSQKNGEEKNMNSVKLSGRLTGDPEVRRYSKPDKDGKDISRKVASFSLAVDIIAGRKQEATSFFRCCSFGKTADIIDEHCRKGDKIIVEGYLRPNNYEKDGVKIYSNDVVVQDIEFCSSKHAREESSNDEKKESDGEEFMDIPDDEELGFPSPF